MKIQDALDLHLKEEAFRIIGKSHGIFFEAGWFSYLAQGGFLFRMPIWTDDNF